MSEATKIRILFSLRLQSMCRASPSRRERGGQLKSRSSTGSRSTGIELLSFEFAGCCPSGNYDSVAGEPPFRGIQSLTEREQPRVNCLPQSCGKGRSFDLVGSVLVDTNNKRWHHLMATKDDVPLFRSDHAERQEQRGTGTAWGRAVRWHAVRSMAPAQAANQTRKNPKLPVEPESAVCVDPDRRCAMQKDKSSQGIVLDEKSQEQPKDKARAQMAHKSAPGHMPQQPVKKDDELQSSRKKGG
jgi:hypothetical protein